MKQPLNASGTALVQAAELMKTVAELAGSMMLLKSDFDRWMDERFVLSASQKEQIANLPTSFKSYMTDAIATELLAGRTVAFAKEESTDPEQEDKDILLSGSKINSYNFGSGRHEEGAGLQIVIRYR